MKPIISLLVALLFVVTACRPTYQWRGDPLDPKAAPDFTLPDANGSTFTLSAQVGNVVLLYFGYTHCPDVCPTTLSDLKQTLNRIGDDAKRVRVAFVSVDPARDTADALHDYVNRFEVLSFIGLRAEQPQLDPLLRAYNIAVRIEPDGTVTHSSSVLLIDPKGVLRVKFPYGLSRESMATDIQNALKS